MTDFGTDYITYAWPVLTETFGETIAHTPNGLSSENVTGVTKITSEGVEHYDDAKHKVTRRSLNLNPADLTSFDRKSVFSIAGVSPYAVEEIDGRSPVLTLQVVNRTELRVGGANSRQER